MNILAIEDSEAFITVLRSLWLEPILTQVQGATLYTATSLNAGLKVLKEVQIDVVLLDLNLPDSRGLETMNAIRKAHPQTPVVVVSGFVTPEVIDMADKEGMEAISKEAVTMKTLIGAIARVFGAKSKNQNALQEASEHIKRADSISAQLAAIHDRT